MPQELSETKFEEEKFDLVGSFYRQFGDYDSEEGYKDAIIKGNLAIYSQAL